MLKDTCAFQPAAFFFFFFKWRHTYDSLGHWVMAGHYKNTEASCHKQVHRWINLLWHLKTLFSKAQRPPAAAVVNSRVGGVGEITLSWVTLQQAEEYIYGEWQTQCMTWVLVSCSKVFCQPSYGQVCNLSWLPSTERLKRKWLLQVNTPLLKSDHDNLALIAAASMMRMTLAHILINIKIMQTTMRGNK